MKVYLIYQTAYEFDGGDFVIAIKSNKEDATKTLAMLNKKYTAGDGFYMEEWIVDDLGWDKNIGEARR